jgi:NAD(P)H dehydrogenase (quinone)
MMLAAEHKATELALAESGLPFVLLRNSWYTENYASNVPAALQFGVVMGCAGQGRISAASRADYAAAAAVVLTTEGQAGKIYELAGDTAFTMADLANEIARQWGKPVAYQDMPQADYAAALVQIGLPEGFAAVLADSDTSASQGALFDDGHQLSRLIGRPTTPVSELVKAMLAA